MAGEGCGISGSDQLQTAGPTIQSLFVRAMPTANADRHATSHCEPLQFWFHCKRRYYSLNVRTFNVLKATVIYANADIRWYKIILYGHMLYGNWPYSSAADMMTSIDVTQQA